MSPTPSESSQNNIQGNSFVKKLKTLFRSRKKIETRVERVPEVSHPPSSNEAKEHLRTGVNGESGVPRTPSSEEAREQLQTKGKEPDRPIPDTDSFYDRPKGFSDQERMPPDATAGNTHGDVVKWVDALAPMDDEDERRSFESSFYGLDAYSDTIIYQERKRNVPSPQSSSTSVDSASVDSASGDSTSVDSVVYGHMFPRHYQQGLCDPPEPAVTGDFSHGGFPRVNLITDTDETNLSDFFDFADFAANFAERFGSKRPGARGRRTHNNTQAEPTHNDAQAKPSHNYAKVRPAHNYARVGHTHNYAQVRPTHDYNQVGHTHNYAQGRYNHDYYAQVGHIHNYAQGRPTYNYAKGRYTHDYAQVGHTRNYAQGRYTYDEAECSHQRVNEPSRGSREIKIKLEVGVDPSSGVATQVPSVRAHTPSSGEATQGWTPPLTEVTRGRIEQAHAPPTRLLTWPGSGADGTRESEEENPVSNTWNITSNITNNPNWLAFAMILLWLNSVLTAFFAFRQ
ncbi:hypothetical protein FQN54_004602 [Arachnomyces sp. PD_36]|nr:hypothetical protein FQN54_004602 [Arachnomyces sp. PD_36]